MLPFHWVLLPSLMDAPRFQMMQSFFFFALNTEDYLATHTRRCYCL